jgi:NADPH2:quinone reductase
MATGSVRYIHQKSHGALPQKEVISLLDTLIAELEAADVSMKRSPFGQPQADAWNAIVPLLRSGVIKPIVAKTFPLAEAADALRYLVEGRPFGRVVLTI